MMLNAHRWFYFILQTSTLRDSGTRPPWNSSTCRRTRCRQDCTISCALWPGSRSSLLLDRSRIGRTWTFKSLLSSESSPFRGRRRRDGSAPRVLSTKIAQDFARSRIDILYSDNANCVITGAADRQSTRSACIFCKCH